MQSMFAEDLRGIDGQESKEPTRFSETEYKTRSQGKLIQPGLGSFDKGDVEIVKNRLSKSCTTNQYVINVSSMCYSSGQLMVFVSFRLLTDLLPKIPSS